MENVDFYFGKYLNLTSKDVCWIIFGWKPNRKIQKKTPKTKSENKAMKNSGLLLSMKNRQPTPPTPKLTGSGKDREITTATWFGTKKKKKLNNILPQGTQQSYSDYFQQVCWC